MTDSTSAVPDDLSEHLHRAMASTIGIQFILLDRIQHGPRPVRTIMLHATIPVVLQTSR